ncbi:MAG: peptide deformylase [Clostridia bacterium]|nr:peptide deformylase [Clostridia bacterium]
MATLKILTDEELLRRKSRPVDKINQRIKTLLDDMTQTMRLADGVGLAAPQVGVLRRVVVIEVEPGEVLELINPEIISRDGTQTGPEGCLSVPGRRGIVERPEHVVLRALDRDGNIREYEGEGLLARAMCHETDHLDGILYTDKAEKMLDEEDDE